MHRVGAHPDDAVTLAKQVQAHPALRLEGVATHLAVADEPDDPATAEQLAVFDDALAELARHGHRGAARPRRQLRRGHRPSAGALLVRPGRHLGLRARTRRLAWRP